MIKNVSGILSNVGAGVTDPLVGIIDNNQVIIKTINNDEGNKILINELVCYSMAKRLNLPMPDGGVCVIDSDTKIEESISLERERYGIGFYTYRLDKVTSIVNSPQLISKYITNKDDFIKIILFDHLIYNKDRHKGNILMNTGSKKDNKIYIIDHSHVFNIGSLWDKCQLKRMIEASDYNSTEIMEFNEGTYSILLQTINLDEGKLNCEASTFKQLLDEEFLYNSIFQAPKEWEIDEEDKNMLFDYIKFRLNNIEKICNVIYNYRRN